MTVYQSTIQTAIEILREDHPRARYAADVLSGNQNWSGSDLKGKARRYSGTYARQRAHAMDALEYAGGCLIALRPSGRIVSAVEIGPDDYGSTLYATARGIVSANVCRMARDR